MIMTIWKLHARSSSKAYDFNYRNHQMDGVERLEYCARLIFL